MSESVNTQKYSVGNADNGGSDFKLPGDQPGEAPFNLDDTSETQYYRWIIYIDNGWNQNVDVTPEGGSSLDSASGNKLDTPYADGSAVTVSSSSVDFINGTTNHQQLQLDVSPAGDPTSGTLTVIMERRKP